ncbi:MULTISPECIES: hypothetical protein [Pseudomonas]|jgi:hypothetical protein|uniref:hypothetical protein n=1 Tax=Pseudomonas TaxID=286 RepID=UPI000B335863|nr:MULTISPECIES: hypothetical protein [Pseudomonas]MCF5511886.1 hypothetical protein [Pseudomonas sp. PA-3-6H]MCF5517574.1 hypothetical protein [Pseudomonas sp. PA-3-6E]MCF5564201.1 hypothetical protein [Pseudomonas sp. PA-3-5D]MCF5571183.1 hypothetical protein [Pseudomonas sp. PA-3-11C]MCF5597041.1 hypothetical protein [Pseudomonas sp. PA-3-10C]
MSSGMPEYKKSLDDELDWSSVEQYHESTMQISNQCFEYKKLCVGALGIIIAAMLKLGTDTTPLLLSLTCLFISTGFWMCDTTAYYYQRVNRQKILNLQTKISNRNTGESIAPPILPNSWNAAIFNKSMLLYIYCSTIFVLIMLATIIMHIVKHFASGQ